MCLLLDILPHLPEYENRTRFCAENRDQARHIRYFGVPGNRYALAHFRFTVSHLWHHVLERRSQKGRVQWERMQRIHSGNTILSHGFALC